MKEYKSHFKDHNLDEDRILDGISIISPRSARELLKVIDVLKSDLHKLPDDEKVPTHIEAYKRCEINFEKQEKG